MGKLVNKEGKEAGDGLYKLHKEKPKLVEEKMGYKMVMGMKENDSPGTFSTKQSKIIQMAPLGPMLQTENENGLKEIDRNTTSTEKMVQGLLGEETTTTIDLASDPTTTTTTGTRSLDEAFEIAKQKGWTLPGEDLEAYKIRAKKDPSYGQNTQYEKEVVEKPGETAQKKETEFTPYPHKDTYQPWEMRAEARNIRQVERRKKNAAVKKARQDAKDMYPEDRKKRKEYIKQQKQIAKKTQRDNVSSGMNDLSSNISTQVEKSKNPNQTDTYQAKPNNSGSDYKNIFSNAAKRIGNMDSSLGNTDFKMQMKPMQFRKVAYSGKKPGKSGYKK